MCGIVGASSKENINMSDIRLMMTLADDRGGHSTGLTNGQRIFKIVGNSKSLLSPETGFVFPDNITEFIGHTRFATEGAKNLANTHPFDLDTVVGVHNGTIDNFKQLNKKHGKDALTKIKKHHGDKEYYQELKEVESDSMLLYYLISRFGLKGTLPRLKGTMGLSFFEHNKGLNIYRFNKPLCYGFKNGVLWYASKKEWLDVLGCTNIKTFKQHTHYVLEEGNIIKSEELETKIAPTESSSQPIDIDSDFTKKERDEGLPEKKPSANVNPKKDGGGDSNGDSSAGSEQQPVGELPDDDYDGFKLGKDAKAGISEDGKVILWKFSPRDKDRLFVEVEGYQNILVYDLGLQQDMYGFKYDCPEIKEQVLQEYEDLELAEDIRKDKTAYVELTE